jgi:hypothetical protein
MGQKESLMFEAPTIIGTCINCIAPGSFGATLALILTGAFVVAHSERRKSIAAKTRAAPGQSS